MPHDGWTIAHLRAASHGDNTYNNTHPFVVDNWAIIHNGIWNEYNIAKMVLSKSINFLGETDSEVAAHCINIAGIKAFNEETTWSGVFLALHINGHLWGIKNSGCLSLHELDNGQWLLGSTLYGYDNFEVVPGWIHFGPNGKYIEHEANRFRDNRYNCNVLSNSVDIDKYDDEDMKQFIKEAERKSKKKLKHLSVPVKQSVEQQVKQLLGPPIKEPIRFVPDPDRYGYFM